MNNKESNIVDLDAIENECWLKSGKSNDASDYIKAAMTEAIRQALLPYQWIDVKDGLEVPEPHRWVIIRRHHPVRDQYVCMISPIRFDPHATHWAYIQPPIN